MKLFGKDLDNEVALIAEIGVNHEGSLDKALELIDLAADAGADAVKFQSYTPERFCAADDPVRLERVTRFSLSEDDHHVLVKRAKEKAIHFFSTAVTEDWVPFLAGIGPAIKIASGDLNFRPVIDAAAKSGVPVILSTGGGTVDEIDTAVEWFLSAAGDAGGDRLILMHCVAAYPVPMEEANLQSVPFLAARYPNLTIGYSNHVLGPEAPLAAVALGARIVEVHFTDQKEGREFRDHALSADPSDLAYLAKMMGQIAQARGTLSKQPMPCETATLPIIRKGLVASRDLEAGSALMRDDLMYCRPSTGFAASELDRLMGRTLKSPLNRGCVLTPEHLTDG